MSTTTTTTRAFSTMTRAPATMSYWAGRMIRRRIQKRSGVKRLGSV